MFYIASSDVCELPRYWNAERGSSLWCGHPPDLSLATAYATRDEALAVIHSNLELAAWPPACAVSLEDIAQGIVRGNAAI